MSVEQSTAVEDAEFLSVQFQVHPVRVAEVHALLHAAIRAEVIHAVIVQLLLRGVELRRGDGDGQVLHPADGLLERRVLMAGEVEEPEHVAVADVEEEVAGARVVPVFHQLHQREAEKLLVELDGLLDVLADQGEMVHALYRGGRPLIAAAQVLLAQLLPARPDLLEFLALRRWHESPPCVIAAGVVAPVTSPEPRVAVRAGHGIRAARCRLMARARGAYAVTLPPLRWTRSTLSLRRCAQPCRPRPARARVAGGTARTGHCAWARQYRPTRPWPSQDRPPRRPAPTMSRSSGRAATPTSTGPGWPRCTIGWTDRSPGSVPQAVSSAAHSCCQAASCQIRTRAGQGCRAARSPPGGTQARTGVRVASLGRARFSACRSARRLPGEPLAPTMTRRTPDTAALLPCAVRSYRLGIWSLRLTACERPLRRCCPPAAATRRPPPAQGQPSGPPAA